MRVTLVGLLSLCSQWPIILSATGDDSAARLAVLIVNQPKCGTGFLTNALVNALSCREERRTHPLLKEVNVHSCGGSSGGGEGEEGWGNGGGSGSGSGGSGSGRRRRDGMVIRSHNPVQTTAALKLYFPKITVNYSTPETTTTTKVCRVVTATRDPRIAVASQFFQEHDDLCSGGQSVDEVLARYDACKKEEGSDHHHPSSILP